MISSLSVVHMNWESLATNLVGRLLCVTSKAYFISLLNVIMKRQILSSRLRLFIYLKHSIAILISSLTGNQLGVSVIISI